MAAKGGRSKLVSETGEEGDTKLEGKSDICADCDKKVSRKDNGLLCESCEGWFHSKCQKVMEDTYKVIGQSGVHWFCNGCNRAVAKILTMLGSLNERQDRLERDIEVVKGDVRLVKNEVNVIAQEQSILKEKCKKN